MSKLKMYNSINLTSSNHVKDGADHNGDCTVLGLLPLIFINFIGWVVKLES